MTFKRTKKFYQMMINVDYILSFLRAEAEDLFDDSFTEESTRTFSMSFYRDFFRKQFFYVEKTAQIDCYFDFSTGIERE